MGTVEDTEEAIVVDIVVDIVVASVVGIVEVMDAAVIMGRSDWI